VLYSSGIYSIWYPTMSRTVYLNGKYLPEEDAKVSVFDRGFLFADGIYEVTTVLEGKLIDFHGHITRLHRSLNELDMQEACSDEELLNIHRELVKANNLQEGLIYTQITRGVADRNFLYPEKTTKSTLVLFTQQIDLEDSIGAKNGLRIITVDDLRWGRRDIKTVQLLYPSMAKMEAKRKGVDDAWLVSDGMVNEGTSNNAYILTQDNIIVTHHLSNDILHGITRKALLKCAEKLNLSVEERPFSIKEAKKAKEAFITSATTAVTPVIEIDGQAIGTGKPSSVVAHLRNIYFEEARKAAI